MNNYVLYRKWRPQSFSELVGQTAIKKTLVNAISQNRIAHAYLFSGPRGTGKTSTARILAKAINCKTENIEDRLNCNSCENCVDINSSNSLDLIEIDAASNRGIDEIRSIRDKSNYSPTKSLYKVYVLDEAHMLTKDASNALLKTLEEPPPHVVFILATTESDKMESTILSRCQRFDFKRIDNNDIVLRLIQISNDENINIAESAILRIAEISEGSLRDAESFLEQVILSNEQEYINTDEINKILGITDSSQVGFLQESILLGNINETLKIINDCVLNNSSIKQLHNSLIISMRQSLINESKLTNYNKDIILHIAKCLKILVNLDFSKSLNHASSLEIAAIEASIVNENTNYKPVQQTNKIDVENNKQETQPIIPIVKNNINKEEDIINPTSIDRPNIQKEVVSAEISMDKNTDDANNNTIQSESWQVILEKFAKIKGERFSIGALLRDCKPPSISGNNLYLSFKSNSNQDRFTGEIEHGSIKIDLLESISEILQIPTLGEIIYDENERKNNSYDSGVNLSVMKALNWGGQIIEEEVQNNE